MQIYEISIKNDPKLVVSISDSSNASRIIKLSGDPTLRSASSIFPSSNAELLHTWNCVGKREKMKKKLLN